MTVEKGRDWGGQGPLPADAIVVGSDAEARRLVQDARAAGAPLPHLALLGGDLARTLGGRGDLERMREHSTLVSVDVGVVVADGDEHVFVAHLVARRRWWLGRVVAAMNAQYLGPWDLAPRAHPSDGRLDVLDASMGLGDKLKARSRLPGGLHVPHPDIAERRVRHLDVDLGRPTALWLDGERLGVARRLALSVLPDALAVAV